jgi:hypothetical protein
MWCAHFVTVCVHDRSKKTVATQGSMLVSMLGRQYHEAHGVTFSQAFGKSLMSFLTMYMRTRTHTHTYTHARAHTDRYTQVRDKDFQLVSPPWPGSNGLTGHSSTITDAAAECRCWGRSDHLRRRVQASNASSSRGDTLRAQRANFGSSVHTALSRTHSHTRTYAHTHTLIHTHASSLRKRWSATEISPFASHSLGISAKLEEVRTATRKPAGGNESAQTSPWWPHPTTNCPSCEKNTEGSR